MRRRRAEKEVLQTQDFCILGLDQLQIKNILKILLSVLNRLFIITVPQIMLDNKCLLSNHIAVAARSPAEMSLS
jgi:hypothetical protein